ncbi:hypothetical protein AcW1_004247 [Taiwanofungus camphoratus]|nr:hypothetical protein AcV5_000628 [Antrodia cinnamomea]KAI0952047.1 hypothetical protein AcV7_007970 [Antrodia cinnamomea]KAI0959423.1 hypothetical protein AcW1_004247 [Antrodia cinnamomea]
MHVIDRRTSQSALAFELHCSCSLHRSRSSPMTMNRKKSKASKSPKATEDVGIPEEDQWRIINQTGILKNLPQSTGGPTVTGVPEEDTPFAEEIFNATLFIIPMSFLLLLMEMYVYTRDQTPSTSDRLLVWFTGSMAENLRIGIWQIGCCQACQVSVGCAYPVVLHIVILTLQVLSIFIFYSMEFPSRS